MSVSVVITTYNRAQFLQRAIESALKAASDPEVIVVDDCSTDNTPEVCAHRSDIRYVRLNANRGLANARNIDIAESSSGQMSSNSAALCKQALLVQQMALARAQSADGAKRRRVRSKLRNRAYEILMTEATNLIHAGDAKSARAKLLDAFQFRPFRAVASGRLPWLLIK